MAEVTTQNNSAAPYELHSGKAAVWCKPPVWPSFASGFLLSRELKINWKENMVTWEGDWETNDGHAIFQGFDAERLEND